MGIMLIEPDMLLMTEGRYCYTERGYRLACSKSRHCLFTVGCSHADVIYADVLPAKRDIEILIEFVRESGYDYQVKVFTLEITPEESKKRNVHDVRHEDIDRMVREWEDWPGKTVIDGLKRNNTEGTEK